MRLFTFWRVIEPGLTMRVLIAERRDPETLRELVGGVVKTCDKLMVRALERIDAELDR